LRLPCEDDEEEAADEVDDVDEDDDKVGFLLIISAVWAARLFIPNVIASIELS